MTNLMIVFKLSLLITIAQLCISADTDTLLPGTTMAVGQNMVSHNQMFELQFLKPGKSTNTFLGIRYKTTPDVVVWVANRHNPIPIADPQGAVAFAVAGNGTLAITRNGAVIWSSFPSTAASRPRVRLLDTGNLVVVDEAAEGYLWQSFDYPTDTMLPGMKIVDDIDSGAKTNLTSWRNSDDPSPGEFVFTIENFGLPELVAYRGENKVYRSGTWNGVQFSSLPFFPNSIFQPDVSFREGKLISVTRAYNSSLFTRFKLEPSTGFIQRYNMNAQKEIWNQVYSFPQDRCDEYGHCGPYAICRFEKAQRCECFDGFSPTNEREWNLQDWSDGCRRDEPLNCESGDGFLEVKGVKFPDMLKYWLNLSMSLQECRDECLRNCSCTAYANTNVSDEGSGCVMWLGDLVDIRQLFVADSKQNLYVRVPILELDATTNLAKKIRRRRPRKLIVILVVTSGLLAAGFIIGCGVILLMTRRRKRGVSDSKVKSEELELPLFKFATIMAATNNFSRENLIGEGGFGPVYKGNLSAEEVAVKRLSRTSKQGLKEFKNEVILIAKLQHRNLVRLLGCCTEGEERLLVYEYLHNKSLNYFIFGTFKDQKPRKFLTWPERFDIIMGIARGLLYLHQDSRLKIIHRDLKTSNILLDKDLNPKISDFGLARIVGEGQSNATTRRVVGTYGYMAPEYAVDGKYSVKSDIFALGVILLEIVTGKKNRGFDHCDHYHSLLGHAWLLWKENDIMELMDVSLSNTFVESQVKRCIHVGLLCVQKHAQDRPIMSSVLFMLGTDGAILPEPKEPGFFIERSPSCIASTSQEALTITELEAR